jgi:hypothetical protein
LVLTLGLLILFPNFAHAQLQSGGIFRFSKEVHWGNAVLPAGVYVFSVPSSGPMVVTIDQKGGGLTTTVVPQSMSREAISGSSRVVMEADGSSDYVTSLYVKEIGAVLRFASPKTKFAPADTQVPLVQNSSETTPTGSGLFAIVNPQGQAVPYAQADAIYLSACKVVEEEFSRTDPVRPKLTLLLGAEKDGVYYPQREIHLTKWNKFRFAQGVVVLAVDDLLPREKRMSLTQLAIADAESTVDVGELKSERARAHGAPQN